MPVKLRRRRRARRVRRLVAGVTIGLLGWAVGLVWFAQKIPVEIADPDTRTDAIVVLTGGSGRLAAGRTLLADGRADKLFISGVYRGVEVDELLRASQSAPEALKCCVVLGHDAENTLGNARETAVWMRQEGYDSLRLVTAAYHMPRSMLEFRAQLPDVRLIAHPVFSGQVKIADWWRWPGTASLIASEYNKYLVAWLRALLLGRL